MPILTTSENLLFFNDIFQFLICLCIIVFILIAFFLLAGLFITTVDFFFNEIKDFFSKNIERGK